MAAFVAVTLAVVLVTISCKMMLDTGENAAAERQVSNMRVAWDVLHQYGSAFRVEGEVLYAGSQPLNGFFEPVDRIKAMVGGVATIFRDDKRIATNVVKADGSRAVGTVLDRGPVYDQVLGKGLPFQGEAMILGIPYYAAYDPIKDASGTTIGILFAGVPKAQFLQSVISAARLLAGISGILILLAVVVMVLVTRKLFAPLVALSRSVVRIANGDLLAELPVARRRDEIGVMCESMQTFKVAAVEAKRLQAEATAARAETDAERASAEATRAQAAVRQAEVVDSLAAGLSRLAAGDLTCHLDKAFAPEYERLRADFNAALLPLQNTVRVITNNSTAMLSGIEQISQAADELSQRTEQQAASLEETAAALSEVVSVVKHTAAGAVQARETVERARIEADQSNSVVSDAVSAMAEIEESASKISQIIGVIDEIAFQTNLLALNAGVEAARAGDAGRGFAVVAAEVRALAGRSASAAKEIKTLISSSSQQVARGTSLVGQTGGVLQRIAAQVSAIAGIVNGIANSAQEQAVSLQQVSSTVNQMDQVTQRNAAMVVENTTASHALRHDAEELARLTGQFRLADVETVERSAS